MKLSKNFTLKELTKSATALRLGIDNKPDIVALDNLQDLVNDVLQPLRDRIGAIRITSGYRNPELCVALGSKKTSQHTKGQAIDCQYFNNGKMDNKKIYNSIISGGLEFDQLILEFGDSTETKDPTTPDWIHISYKCKGNRRQILIAYKDDNNKTQYRKPNNYFA
tara:strand:+ start:1915 stop:2409 length:495 start_codon:yes stop_codon:yes gene_type:complete